MIKHDDIFTSAQRNTTEPKHIILVHTVIGGVDRYLLYTKLYSKSYGAASAEKTEKTHPRVIRLDQFFELAIYFLNSLSSFLDVCEFLCANLCQRIASAFANANFVVYTLSTFI